MELFMVFEKKFGHKIPDESAEKILAVKNAIGYMIY
jgi:acyl carrier protein